MERLSHATIPGREDSSEEKTLREGRKAWSRSGPLVSARNQVPRVRHSKSRLGVKPLRPDPLYMFGASHRREFLTQPPVEPTPIAEPLPSRPQPDIISLALSPKLVRKNLQNPSPRSRCALLTERGHIHVGLELALGCIYRMTFTDPQGVAGWPDERPD